jgi:hypothetical protein
LPTWRFGRVGLGGGADDRCCSKRSTDSAVTRHCGRPVVFKARLTPTSSPVRRNARTLSGPIFHLR